MNRRLRSARIILPLLATIAGCQHLGGNSAPPAPPENRLPPAQSGSRPQAPGPPGFAFAPGHLRAEEIPAEIAALSLRGNSPQASEAERAEAWRRLALLRLAAQNPARNPALAAEAQAAYLQLRPPEPARQEGEIWLALLRELLDREQLLQQQADKIREKERALAELGGEKQRLAQKLAAQEAVSAKLKEDIEKLKLIDLSVEKKRKGFR